MVMLRLSKNHQECEFMLSLIQENKKVYKKMLNRFIEAFVYDLKLGWNIDDKTEK